MPVATAGECRLPGGPRSPRARQLLQKFWLDRHPLKYDVPPKGIVDSFLENTTNASALPLDEEDEGDVLSIGSGCHRPKGPSLDISLPLTRELGFQTSVETKNNNRYIEKNPLLLLHNLECSGDSPENPLPLDLIQSSVTIDDTSETGESSNHGTGHPPSNPCAQTTFTEIPDTSRNVHQNFCSCKRSSKPTWKSYEEAIQKSSGTGGLSLISGSDTRDTSAGETTCWCGSSKLVLYTIYLCVVFLLVFFAEAARMVMVPITVFLIVLSLALFLFILFCVCFIIFI